MEEVAVVIAAALDGMTGTEALLSSNPFRETADGRNPNRGIAKTTGSFLFPKTIVLKKNYLVPETRELISINMRISR